jgi:hypothetical protein
MATIEARIAKLELRENVARELAQPWIPPSREGMAALIARMLPTYAAAGLHTGPVLDEAAIAEALAELPWPESTTEPASIQDFNLLQAALARCGIGMVGAP